MPPLVLTEELRQALIRQRDLAPKSYQRERAAALLKVAAGQPVSIVARHGLLRPRQPSTVYGWLRDFQQRGLAALLIRPGRGRKPAFSPSLPKEGARQGSDSPRGPAGPPSVRP